MVRSYPLNVRRSKEQQGYLKQAVSADVNVKARTHNTRTPKESNGQRGRENGQRSGRAGTVVLAALIGSIRRALAAQCRLTGADRACLTLTASTLSASCSPSSLVPSSRAPGIVAEEFANWRRRAFG